MKTLNQLLLPFCLAGSLLAASGCSSNGGNDNLYEPLDSARANAAEVLEIKQEGGLTIYYGLPSPMEMAMLLNMGTSFYPELLSPSAIIDNPGSATSTALHVGVLGVDFSYSKLYQQEEQARQYLEAIQALSAKLDIPQSESDYERVRDNIENTDSILNIINETYSKTDKYLRDNDRTNTATLVALGGWIEAMFMATNIYYQNPEANKLLLNRIIVQKFSLNYLIQQVSVNQSDPNLAAFLKDLSLLKSIYDKVEIKFGKDEVQTDSIRRVMVVNTQTPLSITQEQLEDIAGLVGQLRKHIVNHP